MNQVKKCALCGSESDQEFIDHGNYISVRCGSVNCGDYEISVAALRKVDENRELAMRLVELAHAAKKCGSVLEIFIDSDNKICTNTISRKRK